MKALIDALEKELKNSTVTSGVNVQAFGPTEELPEALPYINIVPRSKSRTRQFLIGTATKLYDSEPEVELHVWDASMRNLREAFEKVEQLAEKVLDLLADISVSTLGVDWHESEIEEFNDYMWEQHNYYQAVILFKAKKDETHT